MTRINASVLFVKCLEAQGVKIIFGIPGAKIDAIFNALEDSSIELVLCRHEQNAVFMASIYGRLTGKAGVVLVTSGPGVTNLCTGLLTATTEGDPVIAIGGNVSRFMLNKGSHQAAENVKLTEAATKSSIEIYDANIIAETIANAFQRALSPKRGACFISIPQDILNEKVEPLILYPRAETNLHSNLDHIKKAAALIEQSQMPVILLGEEASRPENTKAIRDLLAKAPFPVVSTYQAAGVISEELIACFFGRVGLFMNQPGDQLLQNADCVITIGYNPVEYDSEIWNKSQEKCVIHIDYKLANIHLSYNPKQSLIGHIKSNICLLNI